MKHADVPDAGGECVITIFYKCSQIIRQTVATTPVIIPSDRKGAAVIKPHRTTGSGKLGALSVYILIAFLSMNEQINK